MCLPGRVVLAITRHLTMAVNSGSSGFGRRMALWRFGKRRGREGVSFIGLAQRVGRWFAECSRRSMRIRSGRTSSLTICMRDSGVT